MKKMTAILLSAAMLTAAVPVMPGMFSAPAAVSAETVPFEAERFFVVVGSYDGHPQLRYLYPYADGTYDADMVVLPNATGSYQYGDVFTCTGTVSLQAVQPAAGNLIYAMAYYYTLEDETQLKKAGTCASIFECKNLTVTENLYDGSGHFSVHLADADGKTYYYGLNTYGSTLGVNVSAAQKGDVIPFALYHDIPVVPLADEPAPEVSQTVETTEPQTSGERKGDVNGDGIVDIMDVIRLNKSLLGIEKLTDEQTALADTDGSGTVDSGDSLLILKYALEMIDSFETEVDPIETKNARLLSAPEYPTFPSYPSGDDTDAYITWKNAVETVREQPKGYQDGFDEFFNKSMPVFLKDTDCKNRLYSPLSLYMALGMSAEVTDGESRQQILNLLAQKDLRTLRSHARSIWQANYMDDGMAKILLASSLWTNDNCTYSKDTIGALKEYYYASAYTDKPGSEDYDKLLQDWLNKQTEGMLEDAAAGIRMDPQTVLMLASTVDYSGKWEDRFKKELTASGTFHAPGGDQTCEFMNDHSDRVYYWGEYFGSINLPLENNGYMRLILPDEGVTPEKLLSDPELIPFLTNSSAGVNHTYTSVHLSVPKFDVSSDMDLCDGLKALGVTDIFDEQKADFSPLTKESDGLSLSKAEQAARVTIDEEGCRASALTVMQFVGAPAPQGEVYFTLDRPFIFEIISETGLPLFIGIVNSVG